MSTIGKVCVRCQVELRPKKNGVGAIMMASFGPYQLYDADLWACPICGVELLLGFGARPIREHYMPDFQAVCRVAEIARFVPGLSGGHDAQLR